MSETNDNRKMAGSMDNRMSLARMRAGQKGKIVKIHGGHNMARKLEALGIREGQEINLRRIGSTDFRKNLLRSTAHV